MRAFLQRAAMLLAALATFVVAGELLARTFDLVDRLNGYTRLLFTRGPSDDLPYRLRPGVETTFLATPVRVNSLGFRGPECATTPPPGVYRILLLGDSVAFGLGVGEHDTMASVLERRLRERTGRPYEVINAGIPGIDTVAAVRLLETAGAALHLDAIVLCMSLNDYEPPARYSPLGILTRRPLGPGTTSLLERSEFALLLRWLVGYARGTLAFQRHDGVARARAIALGDDRPTAYGRIVRSQPLRFYHDPDPVLWQRIEDAFRNLRRLTAERDVAALVAIFPEEYQITGVDPDLTPQHRLLDSCRHAGLHCLDLQPAFAVAGGDSFLDVQHPNARGLAVAGAAVAAALVVDDSQGTSRVAGKPSPLR